MGGFGSLTPNVSTVDTVRFIQQSHCPLNGKNTPAALPAGLLRGMIGLNMLDDTFQLSDKVDQTIKKQVELQDEMKKAIAAESSFLDKCKVQLMYQSNHPELNMKRQADFALILKMAKKIRTHTGEYVIWYAPSMKDIQKKEPHTFEKEISSFQGAIAAPIVFAVANYAINETTNGLNKYDSVKNITQNIPDFVSRNGKLVTAAAVAELARTAIEERSSGMTSDNAIKFGKKVTVQVGANFIEEFGIIPMTDSIESSTTKKAVRYGLGIATVAGLDLATGGKGSIGFSFTV